jgi:hypothetical protein
VQIDIGDIQAPPAGDRELFGDIIGIERIEPVVEIGRPQRDRAVGNGIAGRSEEYA